LKQNLNITEIQQCFISAVAH